MIDDRCATCYFRDETSYPEANQCHVTQLCSHSWIAGMMVVNDEDLLSIAETGRTIECEKCDAVYDPNDDLT